MLYFNALFEPDLKEGGFVVTFPDMKWGVTQGEDEDDAMAMAADAVEMIVRDYIERGEQIPRPSKVRGRKYRMVRLPALQSAKAELYMAFKESGMRKAEMARRLGIPKTTVDRLFDFANHTRLDQMEAAFAALGKRLAVEIQDAA
ncbi:MAG: type II toxin-antitoxin system HicB family antitoxin [Acidobacteriia bacterium]|nr:type II toxin-antitoxin system HicB family antitoxin [Terriglobia bacterium]